MAEDVLRQLQESQTETARRTTTEEYAKIYGVGFPRSSPEARAAEQKARAAQQVFENALLEIVARGELPTSRAFRKFA
jgi:hypothetical protein